MSNRQAPPPRAAPDAWARVRLLKGAASGNLWEVTSDMSAGGITVGTDAGCDWRIEEEGVAPRHFDLYWDGQILWATPKSGGQVRIDGEALNKPRPISGRARIEFGLAAMLAETSTPAVMTAVDMPPPSASPDEPTEVVGNFYAQLEEAATTIYDMEDEETVVATGRPDGGAPLPAPGRSAAPAAASAPSAPSPAPAPSAPLARSSPSPEPELAPAALDPPLDPNATLISPSLSSRKEVAPVASGVYTLRDSKQERRPNPAAASAPARDPSRPAFASGVLESHPPGPPAWPPPAQPGGAARPIPAAAAAGRPAGTRTSATKPAAKGSFSVPARTWVLLGVTSIALSAVLFMGRDSSPDPQPSGATEPQQPERPAASPPRTAREPVVVGLEPVEDRAGDPGDPGDSGDPGDLGDSAGGTEDGDPSPAGRSPEGASARIAATEKEAVELMVAGRERDALALYEELVRLRPDEPAYAAIVTILQRRLTERCRVDPKGAGCL